MSGERRLRILTQLAGDERDGSATRLCEVCARVTGTTGAGIMLMAGDVPRGTVCTTDDVSARIEQLQFELGEGPCVDAYTLDRPILEPDLAHPSSPRWTGFTPPVLASGVGAIFGFPLRVGVVRLGALNLYSDHPKHLSDDEHADALVMADVAAEAVLLLQAEAPPGRLAVELEASGEFHYAVHQAAGMVAAQLEVSVGQALVRLRAHAFGNDRPLADVARDVVTRTLRFDADGAEEPTR